MTSKEKIIRQEYRKYKNYKIDIRNKKILIETLKSRNEDTKGIEKDLNLLKLKVEYLDNLIAPLNTHGKKAIYLALIENLPIYAAAERMGITPGAISSVLKWSIVNKLAPRFDMEMFKDEEVNEAN